MKIFQPDKPQEKQEKGIESPYLLARREWMERYGDYVKSAWHWRMIALGCLVIAMGSMAGLISVAHQSKVVPYAVEINASGEAVRVRRADILAKPNANQIRSVLRSWIVGARTVYTDYQAQKALIDETYAYTAPDSPAYVKLAEYHRANNPYTRSSKEVVSVHVTSAVPLSATTWQVEWEEVTQAPYGKITKTEQWQAIITIATSAPTTVEQVMLNPFGVHVKQFDWTKRLTSEESTTIPEERL